MLRLKVAVTFLAALMVILQTLVPIQAPVRPAKIDPAADVGIKVTRVLIGKDLRQIKPQLIPAGLLVTMIGSGYIEKGCDQVVGHRQKKKGMSWREAGSRSLGILKVAELNHQWAQFGFP